MDVTLDTGRGTDSAAYRALSQAVLAIAAELRIEPVLQQLADQARALVGARYAAIGIPDGEGGFARFIPSGMSRAQLEALGELPRTHGLLGAMLESTRPFRADDISSHPRFEGWPPEHPAMASFLGVPIVSKGAVIGAFYLTEKDGGFSEEDAGIIQRLAAHAAIAIENARLYERSRELSIVEERKRLARELHDSVTQTIFGVILTAEAAARLLDTDPERAREEVLRVAELARGAMDEMRGLIFELRPATVEQEGVVQAIRRHADVLERVHRTPIEVEVDCERRLDPEVEQGVFRIAQEALGNALRHADARVVRVRVEMPAGLARLTVRDDGCGFEPRAARRAASGLGLTSMHERADELGARLLIESAPDAGTTVILELRDA